MDNAYIGIDPGKSGGIAVLSGRKVELYCMPHTEADVWHLFKNIAHRYTLYGSNRQAFTIRVTAVIEQVHGYMPGSGTNMGAPMFTFGMSYGGLRMALIGCGIPFTEAGPVKWQRAMGVPPRKKTESKQQYKNRLKARAQQLFPREGVKVTLDTCDALLIAEYNRRTAR